MTHSGAPRDQLQAARACAGREFLVERIEELRSQLSEAEAALEMFERATAGSNYGIDRRTRYDGIPVGRNAALLGLVQNGIEEKVLRKSFYAVVDVTSMEGRKRAFYRARDWATDHGLIKIDEGRVVDLRGGK